MIKDFTGEVVFEQGPKADKEGSYVDTWRGAFQARTVSAKHLFKKEQGGLWGVNGRDKKKHLLRKILHEGGRAGPQN